MFNLFININFNSLNILINYSNPLSNMLTKALPSQEKSAEQLTSTLLYLV